MCYVYIGHHHHQLETFSKSFSLQGFLYTCTCRLTTRPHLQIFLLVFFLSSSIRISSKMNPKTISTWTLTSEGGHLSTNRPEVLLSLSRSTNSTANGGQKLKDKSHSLYKLSSAERVEWIDPQWKGETNISFLHQLFQDLFVIAFLLGRSSQAPIIQVCFQFPPFWSVDWKIAFLEIGQNSHPLPEEDGERGGKGLLICECDKLAISCSFLSFLLLLITNWIVRTYVRWVSYLINFL